MSELYRFFCFFLHRSTKNCLFLKVRLIFPHPELVLPLEDVDEKGKNSCDCDKEDHQAKGPHCSTVQKDDYI